MKFSPVGSVGTKQLALMDPPDRMAMLRRMSPQDLLAYDACFEAWRHDGQRPPQQEGWRTWLMMAGRGYGKTRAGAEWINGLAQNNGPAVRIALVGATIAEVRAVMIEGDSGLLSVAGERRPHWEPSLNRLRWRNGSEAVAFSSENPDGLRGPQHHFAWCDELAKWRNADETWDNLQMTLRGGDRPRALVTTTPRPIPLIGRLQALKDFVQTHGRTDDNMNLPQAFLDAMAATYGGTRIGQQELDGILLHDAEGALWTRGGIERCRVGDVPEMTRVVIGVDPPAGAGPNSDACGIVVAGMGADGRGYVIADHSVQGLAPEGWARAVADAAEAHGADRVVAEANNGGAMVESVLRAAEAALPVKLVHASRGKCARAEPVALLFSSGRAAFGGVFRELEDELCGMIAGGNYEGPGRSPDRADAMVWAMHALMMGRSRMPRVRML